MISLVRVAQDPMSVNMSHLGQQNYSDIIRILAADDRAVKHQTVINIVVNKYSLEKLLPQLMKNVRFVMIESNRHATKIFKNDQDYYFYDSNAMYGAVKCKSFAELAQYIYHAHCFKSYEENFELSCKAIDFAENHILLPVLSKNFIQENCALYSEFSGMYSIHLAAMNGDLNILKQYIACGDDVNKLTKQCHNLKCYDKTPLMIAASFGNMKSVKFLVTNLANVNLVDSEGFAAVSYAVLNKRYEIANYLLDEAKAIFDINSARVCGVTMLLHAVQVKDMQLAEFCLRRNADINAKCDGVSPLARAIEGGNFGMVKLLLKNANNIEGFCYLSDDEAQYLLDISKDKEVSQFLLETLKNKSQNYRQNIVVKLKI
jgi:ankyrin repeat protein